LVFTLHGVDDNAHVVSNDGGVFQNKVGEDLEGSKTGISLEDGSNASEDFLVDGASVDDVRDLGDDFNDSLNLEENVVGVESGGVLSIIEDLDQFKHGLGGSNSDSFVVDSERLGETSSEFSDKLLFIVSNPLFEAEFGGLGDGRLFHTGDDSDDSADLVTSFEGLAHSELLKSLTSELDDVGLIEGVIKTVEVGLGVSGSILAEEDGELLSNNSALGANGVFEELFSTFVIPKESNDVLFLDMFEHSLSISSSSMEAPVDTVQTIVHDDVLSFSFHGHVGDDTTVEFSNIEVSLAGKSENG
jgi:hypothetical protein